MFFSATSLLVRALPLLLRTLPLNEKNYGARDRHYEHHTRPNQLLLPAPLLARLLLIPSAIPSYLYDAEDG